MTIIYWACGWFAGIWLGSTLTVPLPAWLALGIGALLAAVYWRRLPIPFALLLFLAALGWGAARFQLSLPQLDAGHIASYDGMEDAQVTGVVIRPPDIRETYQNLTMESEALLLPDGAETAVHGKVLLRAPRTPLIPYGARITAAGDLEAPQSWDSFDYRAYLAHRDIHSTIQWPAIRTIGSRAGNPLLHALYDAREQARLTIQQLLPQPQAALLSGILLGDDHAIPKDLQQAFQNSGMTHVIAISGFNIAVIAGLLFTAGRHMLGNRGAAWFALAGIVLYTLFVGAEAAVVRAAVMAATFILAARLLGRPTFIPAGLFGAAFFMALLNPHILWDVGFQLSFAATLGLMLYVGPWNRLLQTELQPILGPEHAGRATRVLSELILGTTAATLMTLPLILYHFQRVSLVSPLANLLILPAQPGIMTWGGLATVAGMIHPALGQLPAWIAWLFLSYTIGLVRFLGNLPFASAPLSLSAAGLVACYGLILGLTWFARAPAERQVDLNSPRVRRAQRLALLGAVLVAILLVASMWRRPDGRLHVAFLDVGQGDATFIQGPDGKQMLVDGGQYPSLLLSRVGQQLPFWDKTLDVVVVTHPDADHVAGLVDLLDNYEVGQIITNGTENGSLPSYQLLLLAAQQRSIPLRSAQIGDVIEFGPAVRLAVLHAADGPSRDDSNNESVVMRLSYGDLSLLLTGDAEEPVEKALLRGEKELQATILKAGHHGSNSSSSREFLEVVQPQIAIISAGQDNQFGHPHDETIQRLEETGAMIWRTDELGTIELVSDGHQIWSNVDSDVINFP